MDKKALAFLEHKLTNESLPVKFLIKATIERIDKQKVLFLSLFRQEEKGKKNDKGKAYYKLFIQGKEYATQALQEDNTYRWSKASLQYLTGYWRSDVACYTLGEREIISDYLEIECMVIGQELEAINNFQRKVMQDKLDKKHEKIKNRIDEVMAKVPQLPNDFDKWVDNGPFRFSKYIYYKREGNKIKAYCTECEKEMELIESNITKKNIKHNNSGTCPDCKKAITYKATGKSTQVSDRTNFAIMQKHEDGFVVRYFSGTKSYIDNYKEPELRFYENIRETYHLNEKGELIKKKYEQGYFHQTNIYRWCEDSGKYATPKAYFYTKNINNVIKGTKWQYSCMYDFAKEVNYLYADTFLREYLKHPQIEYLIKFKLYQFVNEHLSSYYTPSWIGVNFKAKNIREVLGIDKPLFMQLKRLDLGNTGLRLVKDALSKEKLLSDHQVKWVIKNVRVENFIDTLDYSTPHKIISYVNKQASSKYSPENVLSDWCDYIRQCKELKFDLNNTFVLYPKNLKEKHEEYSIMNKSKGLEKYDSKVRKSYARLNDSYSYADKKYSIRPAADVYEIVAEGHKLRHCVGGSNYISKVASGDKAIMLIRRIDAPGEPFYTLELNLNIMSVSQTRGYKNCDMTEEIKKFIEKWKKNKLTEEMLKVV